MNRFRVISTLVAAAIAMNTALLGLSAQSPPAFPIPPILVVAAVILNAGLAVVQINLPSWGASPAVARAATAAETPPRG